MADANKVGGQGTKNGCNVQAEYDFLFSGLSNESDSIVASGDCVRLVEEPEIAGVPGGKESHGNDNQNQ